MEFAQVAVPVPLSQAFTYRVDGQDPMPGCRVLCQFGPRRLIGVVLRLTDEAPDIPKEKIKALGAVIDTDPCLPEELLRFLESLSNYYLAPIGEVVRLALPTLERSAVAALAGKGLADGAKLKATGRLVQVARWGASPKSETESETDPDAVAKLKGQAAAIAAHLEKVKEAPVAELQRTWGNARTALRRLESAGLVRIERVDSTPDRFLGTTVGRDIPPELTAAQATSCRAIIEPIKAREPATFLLHGITGSGKTEVYLRAVQACMGGGGGAIVLVPEIALTPQLVSRFRARLGDEIAVLHSGLSDGDRHHMWKRIRQGELRVVIGARSALFAPIEDLRLLCVDEEHDASFKQEDGVRYHARDMALLRAHLAGAVCVLGSATPSLNTEGRVAAGKIVRLSLPERANRAASLPKVELVDLRRTGPGPAGDRLLSLPLHRALEARLAAKEQSILFLNRRGFAPTLFCEACGTAASCPNCSVSLTLHRAHGAQLRCHYCDYKTRQTSECERCHSDQLSESGAGTERIETALQQCFPSAQIARLDRDVAGGLKSEAVLNRMRTGEVDILVGTQMVTKGHDLPNVTLVGVLNADAALAFPDFRAAERSFQQLVQVAGRSGRSERPGTVIIQTFQPEHPAIALAARHAVNAFAKRELVDRRELGYPPFSHLALVRVSAVDERVAQREAARLAGVARTNSHRDVELLGPAPAPIARVKNRWRFRFMLRTPTERRLLRPPLRAVLASAGDRRVRVSVDLDPENML